MKWKSLLKKSVEYCVIAMLIVFNLWKYGYIVDEGLVNTILTLVSILFGFLISSICNLFGRKITKKLDMKIGVKDPGCSQLNEMKIRFLKIINYIMVLVVISIVFYLAKGFNLGGITCIIQGAYAVSVIYIYLLFKVLCLTYNEVKILLNLLVNENRI